MITSLVEVEAAKERLAAGELPYAFEISDNISMLGPACGYGASHLRNLQTKGGYAASFDEAIQIATARGAIITGIWFVKS